MPTATGLDEPAVPSGRRPATAVRGRRLRPGSGPRAALRPRARRRAPQSTDHSAMSFGGSQPRQPHGREVSAEFRKRFAGRVNRTGRDGQLENYSRVRPARAAPNS